MTLTLGGLQDLQVITSKSLESYHQISEISSSIYMKKTVELSNSKPSYPPHCHTS